MTPVLYAFPDDGDATLDAVLNSLPDALRHDLDVTVHPISRQGRKVARSYVVIAASTEWGYSAFALAAHGRARLLS